MHYRKTRRTYVKHNSSDTKSDVCTLCDEKNRPRIISENATMYIMPNRVSYDLFEERRVTDHLMVVPKRHVETLADFTKEENLDYMALIGKYEQQGYNVYARGVGSITRSVAHQHTHLIKLRDKKSSLIIFTRKPHFLLDV